MDRLKSFPDWINGGAWPFLVRGVIRQLNCDNERDLFLLNSFVKFERILQIEVFPQGSISDAS